MASLWKRRWKIYKKCFAWTSIHLHALNNRDRHLPNLEEGDHKGGAWRKRGGPKNEDKKKGVHAFLLKISHRKPFHKLLLLTFSFFLYIFKKTEKPPQSLYAMPFCTFLTTKNIAYHIALYLMCSFYSF